jgi:hypothetical protein
VLDINDAVRVAARLIEEGLFRLWQATIGGFNQISPHSDVETDKSRATEESGMYFMPHRAFRG